VTRALNVQTARAYLFKRKISRAPPTIAATMTTMIGENPTVIAGVYCVGCKPVPEVTNQQSMSASTRSQP
jgi:hypothetical protein